ncbi:universal stress protein [Emticicia fontis]
MNKKIENILFPTDFSETANNALMVATSFAKREDATLHLLHVVVPKFSSVSRSHEAWLELEKKNKKGLKRLANALERQYKIRTITHTAISYIHAAECIEELAEQLNTNLIVMGSHGLSGSRAFFMGSNTYTVMRNVSCPVLAVPADYKKFTFRNILLPFRRMAEIETKFKIISHFFTTTSTKVEFLGVASFTEFTSFDSLTNQISKLAINLRNQGVELIHRNEFCDDIADFVLEYADSNDAELLVINPMIDDEWKDFSLGTHAQKILNHANKPVLCIKSAVRQEEKQ